MEKVLVIGGGGHAGVVIDILLEAKQYDIAGLIVNDEDSVTVKKYPVLGNDCDLPALRKRGFRKAAIGVGGFTDNKLRTKIFSMLTSLDFEPVNAIHPNAAISTTAKIGTGCVIFPGAVLNTDVVLGNNIIIATGAIIDHGTVLEDHVLVSAGVTVGAYSRIKEGALLALGAKVVSGISVGEQSLIYAGAMLVRDVEKNDKVAGVPAKRVNKKNP